MTIEKQHQQACGECGQPLIQQDGVTWCPKCPMAEIVGETAMSRELVERAYRYASQGLG